MDQENTTPKPSEPAENNPRKEREVCAPRPRNVGKGWVELPVDLWGSCVNLFIGTRDEMSDDVELYFCGRDAEIAVADNWLRRHPSGDKHTDGDTFGDSGLVFIRVNTFFLGDLDDLAILSHECLHAANSILRHIGVMGDDNVEVLAYTQEFIFKGLLKKIMSDKISPIGSVPPPKLDLERLFGQTQEGGRS